MYMYLYATTYDIRSCDPNIMKYDTLLYIDHLDFLAVNIVYQRNKSFSLDLTTTEYPKALCLGESAYFYYSKAYQIRPLVFIMHLYSFSLNSNI